MMGAPFNCSNFSPDSHKSSAAIRENASNNSASFSSEVVSLVNSATDFVKNIQPKKLLPSSGKLKREVSMEEIIQVRLPTFGLTSANLGR